MLIPRQSLTRLWAIGAAALVGCAEGPSAPNPQPSLGVFVAGAFDPVRRQVSLCKIGTDATFDVTIGGVPSTVSLTDGSCTTLVTNPPSFTTASVTEQSDPNIVLDSILVIRGFARTDAPFPTTVDTIRSTGTATASGSAGLETGAVIVFYNHPAPPPPPPPPPPPGGQGCTPGYWKQSQHFDSWVGYTTGQSFEAVFGRDVPGTPTLLEALGANGGGINALMRHTTAALLNTSSGAVNYGMTTAQVISAFQAAYDSGDIEGQKNRFEALNQSGCPLN